jgi:hypothetical protein
LIVAMKCDVQARMMAQFQNATGKPWPQGESMAGGVYVQPPGAKDCGEEYVYTVELAAGVDPFHPTPEQQRPGAAFRLTCAETDRNGTPDVVLFSGAPADFDGSAIEEAQRKAEDSEEPYAAPKPKRARKAPQRKTKTPARKRG